MVTGDWWDIGIQTKPALHVTNTNIELSLSLSLSLSVLS